MTNFPSVCVCARQAETLRPFRAPPILNIKFPSPSNQNWRISISFEEKRQEWIVFPFRQERKPTTDGQHTEKSGSIGSLFFMAFYQFS